MLLLPFPPTLLEFIHGWRYDVVLDEHHRFLDRVRGLKFLLAAHRRRELF